MNRNIVLIGMPGSGKSKLGMSIARKTFMRFVDTDRVIKEKYGEISDIFSNYGESFFRTIEKKVVLNVSKEKNSVISTGGGVILNEDNMTALKSNGIVVYLKVDIDIIYDRIKNSSRPIAKEGHEGVVRLYESRREMYEKYADITIDANGYDIDEKVNTILAKINQA